MYTRALLGRSALFLGAFPLALAHPHHAQPSADLANLSIDTILWIHIALQVAVWGVLFPIGMVLGITKSKWHVPLQVRSPFRRRLGW